MQFAGDPALPVARGRFRRRRGGGYPWVGNPANNVPRAVCKGSPERRRELPEVAERLDRPVTGQQTPQRASRRAAAEPQQPLL